MEDTLVEESRHVESTRYRKSKRTNKLTNDRNNSPTGSVLARVI